MKRLSPARLSLRWLSLLAFFIFVPFSIRADTDLIMIKNQEILTVRGGASGVFAGQGGKVTLAPANVGRRNAFGLTYDVSNGTQDGGAWFALNHFDVRPFEAVEFF